jgi:hypothetical protein
MSKKSQQIIDSIKKANNKEQAVSVIKSIIEALDMTQEAQTLNRIHSELQVCGEEFTELEQKYKALEVPREYSEVQELRTQANFLYRKIVDEYVHTTTRLRTLYEEQKTTERNVAMKYLKNSPEHSDVPKSSLRDYLGAAPNYKEWMVEYAMARGNYDLINKLLESIRLFTDSLASELKGLHTVNVKDVK